VQFPEPCLLKAFLCILLLSCGCGQPFVAEEQSHIANRVRSSVVMVVAYNSNGEELSTGSGFFAGEGGDDITCLHVMADAHRAAIVTPTGERYAVVQVDGWNAEANVIRLSTDIPHTVASLPLSPELPARGQQLVVVNHLNGPKHAGSCAVAAVREIEGLGNFIVFDASPHESCGSPVVNESGEVVGTAGGRCADDQKLSFAATGTLLKGMSDSRTVPWDEWRQQADAIDVRPMLTAIFTGRKLGENGKYAEALKCFNRAIHLFPKNTKGLTNLRAAAWCGLGAGHLYSRNPEKAHEALQKALQIKPRYGKAYYNLGVAYARMRRWKKALAAYRRAINIRPNSAKYYSNCGEAYYNLGRREDALTALRQAVSLDPALAEAHFNLGVVHYTMGDSRAARKQYEILKKLNGDIAERLLEVISD
jgi:tetratricopeptide (TPR) repeat protein